MNNQTSTPQQNITGTSEVSFNKENLIDTLENLLLSIKESHRRWGANEYAHNIVCLTNAYKSMLFVWQPLFTELELRAYDLKLLELLIALENQAPFDSMELWRIKAFLHKKLNVYKEAPHE